MYKTLIELIQDRLDMNLHIGFIEKQVKRITVDELYYESLRILNALNRVGIKQNDMLIFQIARNENFLKLFWACILGGIVPVPLNLAQNEQGAQLVKNVRKEIRESFVITDVDSEFSFLKDSDKILYVNQLELSDAGVIVDVKEDDLAYIQFSSGSTGTPKGVMLTHKNLIYNVNSIFLTGKFSDRDNLLSWLPFTFDMGLIGMHLAPLFIKVKQDFLPTPVFLKNPLIWFDLITQNKYTLVSGPNFGYKLMLDSLKQSGENIEKNWDLSSVSVIFNGGESVSASLCENFLQTMSKFGLSRAAMKPCYGMAETSLLIAFNTLDNDIVKLSLNKKKLNIGESIEIVEDQQSENVVTIVSTGQIVDFFEVKIGDFDGVKLDDGKFGYIYLKGPSVMKGYVNNIQTTNKVLDKTGWLHTDDLGFMLDGRLYVVCRTNDMVVIYGHNYYTSDIEKAIRDIECEEIEEIVACGRFNSEKETDEVLIFCKTDMDWECFLAYSKKLVDSIYQSIGIFCPLIFPVKEIPKTSSGKVKKNNLVELYDTEEFVKMREALLEYKGNMKQKENKELVSEIQSQLLAICKEILNVDDIGINENLVQYGIDSIKVVEINQALEELYPGKVKMSDLFSSISIRQIGELITGESDEKILPVEFPEEYFDQVMNEKVEYEITIEHELLDRLKQQSEKENIHCESILIAAYAYLFHVISDKNLITIPSVYEESYKLKKVVFDFEKVDTVHKLFGFVESALQNATECILGVQNDIIHKDNSVLPVFIIGKESDVLSKYENLFHIVCSADMTQDEIILFWSFQQSFLRKDKMQSIQETYLRIIDYLLNEIDKES